MNIQRCDAQEPPLQGIFFGGPSNGMSRSVLTRLIWLLAAVFATAAFAAEHEAVVHRVRAELANLIVKQEAAMLPVDKRVSEFGADELTVVEWVMALEEAFRIRIPDERIVDPKSKTTRKDLSIARMASVVSDALARAKGKR